MDDNYRIFWGDTHHNTYQHYVQDPPISEILASASAYLDFYTGAYYTPAYVTAPVLEDLGGPVAGPKGGHLSEALPSSIQTWAGVHLEGLKDLEPMAREWREFQEVIAYKLRIEAGWGPFRGRFFRMCHRQLESWARVQVENDR